MLLEVAAILYTSAPLTVAEAIGVHKITVTVVASGPFTSDFERGEASGTGGPVGSYVPSAQSVQPPLAASNVSLSCGSVFSAQPTRRPGSP